MGVELARRLGDGAGERRVDRERPRDLVDGEPLLDGDRDREDRAREARGATTTPPTTIPVPGRQNSFTNPSVRPCIFARALVASGSLMTRTSISPASACACVTPTVAISGSVNTLLDTLPRSSGLTASPSACHIAMRPCMAATDASMSTPVTSPAAYTPRAAVRETRSTSM